MVTQREEPIVEDVGQPEPDIQDAGEVEIPAEGDEGTDATAVASPTDVQQDTRGPSDAQVNAEVPPIDAPGIPQQANSQTQEIQELQRRRAEDDQRQWEAGVVREAKAMEQQALERGEDPRLARKEAVTHVRHKQAIRTQEGKAMDLIGFVQGRSNAALHFAQKYKLLDKQMAADIQALSQFGSPKEMEYEARRMADTRALRAENARLKQGRVSPQQFDDSQGSAEGSSSDQRLLDQYNSGIKTRETLAAVKRITFGA